MKYFIGGVNGVGKTTLLLAIKKARPDFEIIKGSQHLMEYLGFPGDYDALRTMSFDYASEKFGEMIEILLRKHENIIFDSHYLNLVEGVLSPPVTGEWIQKFDVLLLLDASPETVLQRIQNESRDRALFPRDTSVKKMHSIYENYIQAYRNEFQRVVDLWHLPSKILDAEKSTDEIAQDFIAFDESLRKNTV